MATSKRSNKSITGIVYNYWTCRSRSRSRERNDQLHLRRFRQQAKEDDSKTIPFNPAKPRSQPILAVSNIKRQLQFIDTKEAGQVGLCIFTTRSGYGWNMTSFEKGSFGLIRGWCDPREGTPPNTWPPSESAIGQKKRRFFTISIPPATLQHPFPVDSRDGPPTPNEFGLPGLVAVWKSQNGPSPSC